MMKVSELIKELQVAKAAMGDVEVKMESSGDDVGCYGVITMGKPHTGYVQIVSQEAVEAL